jgi:EmrB/QacA subfamily drug resistance transporter
VIATPVADTTSDEARVPVTAAQRNIIVLGLVLATLVAALNQTSIAAVLPVIIADLEGLETYPWVFTAAMLTATITTPIVGRLSDMHGRRSYFLGGLLIFLASTVACGFANSMASLIGARAIQGIGMGVLITLALAVVGDIVPTGGRARLQGLLAVVFGLATILGPISGGWLAGAYGWRSIFFVNLPFGAVAFVVVWVSLRIPTIRRQHAIDWTGAALLTGATACALIALTWGGIQYPWSSARVIGLLAAAVVLGAGFVAYERRVVEPLIPLELLYRGTFARNALVALLSGAVLFVPVLFVPIHMQGVLGIKVDYAAIVLVPFVIGFAVTGGISGFVLKRSGSARALVAGGAVLGSVGLMLLARLTPQSVPADIHLGLAIVGAGLGAIVPTLVNVAQYVVSPKHMGVGTAIEHFARSFGGTIGVAIMGALVNNTLLDNLVREVPERFRGRASQVTFRDLSEGAARFLNDGPGSFNDTTLEIVRAGLNESLVLVYAACIPVLLAAGLIGLTLRYRDPPT